MTTKQSQPPVETGTEAELTTDSPTITEESEQGDTKRFTMNGADDLDGLREIVSATTQEVNVDETPVTVTITSTASDTVFRATLNRASNSVETYRVETESPGAHCSFDGDYGTITMAANAVTAFINHVAATVQSLPDEQLIGEVHPA